MSTLPPTTTSLSHSLSPSPLPRSPPQPLSSSLTQLSSSSSSTPLSLSSPTAPAPQQVATMTSTLSGKTFTTNSAGRQLRNLLFPPSVCVCVGSRGGAVRGGMVRASVWALYSHRLFEPRQETAGCWFVYTGMETADSSSALGLHARNKEELKSQSALAFVI